MQLQPEQGPTIGYVVSTWPRLSQTFVLNEILVELGANIFASFCPRKQRD